MSQNSAFRSQKSGDPNESWKPNDSSLGGLWLDWLIGKNIYLNCTILYIFFWPGVCHLVKRVDLPERLTATEKAGLKGPHDILSQVIFFLHVPNYTWRFLWSWPPFSGWVTHIFYKVKSRNISGHFWPTCWTCSFPTLPLLSSQGQECPRWTRPNNIVVITLWACHSLLTESVSINVRQVDMEDRPIWENKTHKTAYFLNQHVISGYFYVMCKVWQSHPVVQFCQCTTR